MPPKPQTPVSLLEADYQLAFGGASSIRKRAPQYGTDPATFSHWLRGQNPIPASKMQSVLSFLEEQAQAVNRLFQNVSKMAVKANANSAPVVRHTIRRNAGNGTLSKPL